MIETTVIKLETAAELLGVTKETLLIAAMEERIQIYGLLGQYICVRRIQYSDPDSPQQEIIDIVQTHEHVNLVELTGTDASYLIRNIPVHPYILTKPDKENRFCVAHFETDIDEKSEPETFQKAWNEWLMTLEVRPDMVFMMRSDVTEIVETHKTPEKNSVRKEASYLPPQSTPKDSTLISIIASLLDQLHYHPADWGLAPKIEEWTEHMGLRVTDDTIRKALLSAATALEEAEKDKKK